MQIEKICRPDYISNDMAIVDDARAINFDKDTKSLEEMVVIVFVRKGLMELVINGDTMTVSTRQILLCRPGHYITSTSYSPDFSGHALILSMRYGQSILSVAGNIWDFLVSIDPLPIIEIPDTLRSTLVDYYNLLKHEVAHTDNLYYNEVVNSIVRAMLCSLINDVRKYIRHNSQIYKGSYKGSKQSLALFNGFMDLLINEHFTERKISYYADRLCVTPRYLSTICRKVSNRSAHQWICDTMINGINNSLLYSTMSIKEIAMAYKFPTLQFFSKFVKDHLGKSPSEIRRQVQTAIDNT